MERDATAAALRARARLRLRPPCAKAVPRPRRAGRAARLQLTHMLTAVDLNPRYVGLWPLAALGVTGLGAIVVAVVASPSIHHVIELIVLRIRDWLGLG